jgi:hypothetical protein
LAVDGLEMSSNVVSVNVTSGEFRRSKSPFGGVQGVPAYVKDPYR